MRSTVISLPPPLERPDSDEARRLKREQKRAEDATRPLDAWERYRALSDAIDEEYGIVDIANREARFALIIMGALNAALFVVASRLNISAALASAGKPWLILAFAGYAAASIYFLLSAIHTLQPRSRGTARRSALSWDAWQTLPLADLNAYLAGQVQSLSAINEAKQAALRRLYAGLRVLTVTVASVLVLLGFFTSF